MYDFVRTEAFDHVGVFTYSPEEGTKAAALGDHVSAEVAEERRGLIMELQQGISLRKNQTLIGQEIELLVEGAGEIEDELGRIEPVTSAAARRHAPEVDGLVFVPGEYPIGTMMTVRVTDAAPLRPLGHPGRRIR